MELKSVTYKDIKWFDKRPFEMEAKCVKVYDGDTITVAFDTFGLGIFKHSVRINNIDTPEMSRVGEVEKEMGKKARDYLSDLILDKIITVKCIKRERYGRLLSDISVGNVDVATKLIEAGLAVEYHGVGPRFDWAGKHTNADDN